MAIDTGLQQQKPLAWSAAVRSVPAQRPGARMHPSRASVKPEEKRVASKLER